MFNEMIMKSPQRREKRKKKNKFGRPQRTVRKKRRRQTQLNGVLRGKSGRRIKTDTTVPLGNSRELALTTKVSMLGSGLDNKKKFGSARRTKKKSHGRCTQVSLCHLFGHVCDICWSM